MENSNKRWQDVVNILLGIWLFISPLAMGYADTLPEAAQNAYVVGLAIVLFAAVAIYAPKAWEEWVNIPLGIWCIASPWALKYSADKNPTTNAVIVGVLVTVLAVWAMFRDKDFERWMRDHHLVQ